MFPYPSGRLHMGHVRVYTLSDVNARWQRLKGREVLHPIGFDAFGLPAENAARERGVDPKEWTYQNIDYMRDQLKQLGLSFDWDKELITCDPSYYRWTQWLFLLLKKSGLAYQKDATVNWDPVDQTVLANEQVDSQGRSWRSGAIVEQKSMRQWFFAISKYAQRLYDDLDLLTGHWPDSVITMQKQWIGPTPGALVSFPLTSKAGQSLPRSIQVFTTRPETLYGVTFLALAPDHPLLQDLGGTAAQPLPITCHHPLTGAVLPVFTADYVVGEYGTGAVMGVPAHDARDADFARRHDLAFRVVLQNHEDDDVLKTELVNSGALTGLSPEAAVEKLCASHPTWIQRHTQFRLRDWLISRQRAWGTPVPIVYCQCQAAEDPSERHATAVGLTAADLPLMHAAIGRPHACPQCGNPHGRLETDTMDTFVDSSWYFLRYTDPHNPVAIFDSARAAVMPVDLYIGGKEHAILHLLYARFIHKVLYDHQLVATPEPFAQLLAQGMVQSRTFKHPETEEYLRPEQVAGVPHPKISWEKMSKSKYNGVDPQDIIAKYGADTTRLFVLFKAPPELDLQWDDSAIAGPHRFLARVLAAVQALPASLPPLASVDAIFQQSLLKDVHQLIGHVNHDLELLPPQPNTAIASMMKLANLLSKHAAPTPAVEVWSQYLAYRSLVIMLAPFCPHLASECWDFLEKRLTPENEAALSPFQRWAGRPGPCLAQPWPQVDDRFSQKQTNTFPIVIQIDGKSRGRLDFNAHLEHLSDDEMLNTITHSHLAPKFLKNRSIVKIIKQTMPVLMINFITENN